MSCSYRLMHYIYNARVGCIPPACQPYMLWWMPRGVRPGWGWGIPGPMFKEEVGYKPPPPSGAIILPQNGPLVYLHPLWYTPIGVFSVSASASLCLSHLSLSHNVFFPNYQLIKENLSPKTDNICIDGLYQQLQSMKGAKKCFQLR